MKQPRERQVAVRLLSMGPFVTMFDRFAIAPLLIPIARDFHAPLAAVAITATAYYFLYGLGQPFWGFLSDRAGRVQVMRWSLAAVAVGATLSALAPNLAALIGARLVTGVAVCAIMPTALVYVGDAVPLGRRQGVIADLQAMLAVGTALGTVAAGFFAHFLTWRLAFACPAAVAAVLFFAFRRLPESRPGRQPGGPRAQIRLALRRGWARFLVLYALPEGAVILGFLVYLAPALEQSGANPALAGLVVAAYGAAVLAGTQVVKRMVVWAPPWVPIAVGGTMVCTGYLAAALDQHVFGVLVASVMIGGCYSFMHSGLQAWATDIEPAARGISTALFVTCAFTGGALGSAAGSVLAQAHEYRLLFLGALALSLPVVVVGAVARSRYPGAEAHFEAAVS
jgi:predicted MFS family arabinose efflux permease